MKTLGDKLLECLRPFLRELEFRGIILSDVVKGTHGIHVEEGRLSLGCVGGGRS